MKELDMTVDLFYHPSNDSVTWKDTWLKDGSNCTLDWNYWESWPQITTEYHYWGYPTHTAFTKHEDKYKKAFRIAKFLLKRKLLGSRKLNDFIDLVEVIAKEL